MKIRKKGRRKISNRYLIHIGLTILLIFLFLVGLSTYHLPHPTKKNNTNT